MTEKKLNEFKAGLQRIAEYDDRDEDVERYYEEAARYEAECEQEASNEDR